jgi:hypothetical protein
MSASDPLLDRQAALIRLADVPRLKWLPRRRGGTRLAIATVHRWSDPTRPIHLRTTRVGGCRCTTEDWLREFFDRMSGVGDAAPVVPARTPARRDREVAAAERELAAAGIA